jgi:MFS family permease
MNNTDTVFSPERRSTTFGILLGMSLVAFESLSVATIAPTFAEALGGMELYGWVFSSFLLMSLLGVILAGQHIDRRGPWPALAAGLIVFGAGLTLSGLAPSMLVLLAGRALQGLGGGAINTALYAAVDLAYPDALRPRMMALLSTAWILPTLLGPALAGVIADALNWRVIFLGLIPFLVVLAFLIASTFRGLRSETHVNEETIDKEKSNYSSFLALQATVGAGLFLVGLSLSSPLIILATVSVGTFLAVPALRRLLPPQTLTAGPGLAAVLAARALFSAAFAGVQIFLAVLVTAVQGYSASVAGLVIALGSIFWTLGTWLQARQDKLQGGTDRAGRVFIGTLGLSLGIGLQLVALAFPQVSLFITILGWSLAGLGIGFAHATASVLAFAYADTGQSGKVSSALQLADQFTPALSTGIAGVLFTVISKRSWGEIGGVGLAIAFSLVLALFSTLAARRIGDVK